MKLKSKVAIIIGCGWLLMATLLVLLTHTILKQRLAQQIDRDSQMNSQLILRVFNERIANLANTVDDWSVADDFYHFVTKGDENDIAARASSQSFQYNHLSFLLIVAGEQKVLYKKYYNISTEEFIPFADSLLVTMANKNFIKNILNEKREQGFFKANNQLFLLSAKPIVNPASGQLTNAVLIIGTQVDNFLLKKIRSLTQLKFDLLPINQSLIPAGDSYHIELKNDYIHHYFYLNDIFDQPFTIIRALYPAQFYHKEQNFILLFMWLLFIGMVIGSLLFWIALHQLILKRIKLLIRQINDINKKKKLINTIVLKGSDELSFVAKKINELLHNLLEAYHKNIADNNKQLDYMLHHDYETQLPNKAYFNRLLHDHVERYCFSGSGYVIFLISLKNIDAIRDGFSDAVVLSLIQQIAIRLQALLFHYYSLARYANDEFIFYASLDTIRDQIDSVGKDIIQNLTKPFIVENEKIYLKVDVCFLCYPTDVQDIAVIIEKLHIALAIAKQATDSQLIAYQQTMHSSVQAKVILESNLYEAIKNQEFELFFQPKISLAHFTMSSVEALIRWRHPHYGMIPPSEFISVAEDTGLIKAIGLWSLQEACQKVLNWHSQGALFTVAVNVSAVQFAQQDFVDEVRGVLQLTGCPAHCIEIELTESSLIGDIEFIVAQLKKLADLGIKIAIDDFGTGYSSLNYLKRLPVNAIKIDKSFIDDVPRDKNNQVIYQTIISLAKTLDLLVIAEGVENKQQFDFLQQHDCDMIQGYIFSKPLSNIELMALFYQWDHSRIQESDFWRKKIMTQSG